MPKPISTDIFFLVKGNDAFFLDLQEKVPKKKDLRLRQIGDTCRLTALCQSIVPQGLFVPERAVRFGGIALHPKVRGSELLVHEKAVSI